MLHIYIFEEDFDTTALNKFVWMWDGDYGLMDGKAVIHCEVEVSNLCAFMSGYSLTVYKGSYLRLHRCPVCDMLTT